MSPHKSDEEPLTCIRAFNQKSFLCPLLEINSTSYCILAVKYLVRIKLQVLIYFQLHSGISVLFSPIVIHTYCAFNSLSVHRIILLWNISTKRVVLTDLVFFLFLDIILFVQHTVKYYFSTSLVVHSTEATARLSLEAHSHYSPLPV